MAIAFVKDTFSGTHVVTVPAGGFAAGNLLCLGAIWDDATNVVSGVADTRLNTWARAVSKAGAGSTVDLWYTIVTTPLISGDLITVTIGGGQDPPCIVGEWSGLAAVPLDKTQSASDATTVSHTSNATAATTQADELLVGFHGYVGSVTWTGTGGFAVNEDQLWFSSFRSVMQYQIVAATAAYASTGTTSGNTSANNVIATFKATASGPAPDTTTRRYQIRTSRMTSW